MIDDRDPTFEKVSKIIAECIGSDPTRITMDSDLFIDLGVAGTDGDTLFGEIDREFDVNWTGLDLGVYFGNEGLGLPLPWHLSNNCVMYETQSCRVSDIVQAVQSGRWPGTKQILRPKSQRVIVYLISTIQAVLLLGGLLFFTVMLVFGLFG